MEFRISLITQFSVSLDELTEMQKRIQHWIQRAQQMSEEHQKELDEEKERRRHDLHQQSEDHKATVETI